MIFINIGVYTCKQGKQTPTFYRIYATKPAAARLPDGTRRCHQTRSPLHPPVKHLVGLRDVPGWGWAAGMS